MTTQQNDPAKVPKTGILILIKSRFVQNDDFNPTGWTIGYWEDSEECFHVADWCSEHDHYTGHLISEVEDWAYLPGGGPH